MVVKETLSDAIYFQIFDCPYILAPVDPRPPYDVPAPQQLSGHRTHGNGDRMCFLYSAGSEVRAASDIHSFAHCDGCHVLVASPHDFGEGAVCHQPDHWPRGCYQRDYRPDDGVFVILHLIQLSCTNFSKCAL